MKNSNSKLQPRSRNIIIASGAAIAVLVAGYLLVRTFAGGLFAVADPEQGTLTGSAKLVSDSTATGGQAIQFTAPATPPPPPPPSTSCSTYTATTTFGQCGFPTAATTGVPANVTLKPQEITDAAGLVIETDGTVIDGRNIKGYIEVRANNVTIQNTLLTGTSWFGIKLMAGKTNLKVSHVKIVGAPAGGAQTDYGVNSLGNGYFEVAYSDISGFKEATTGSSYSIHDSYVHNLRPYEGAHTQCVYIWPGGTGVSVVHNTLINDIKLVPNITASVYIDDTETNQKNHIVKNNWMAGGSYTFYGGDAQASNIQLIDNVFSTEIFPSGGYYGHITSWHPNNPGFVASGNVWGNGANAGKSANP